MTIEDGHIRTRPATNPVGHRGTVDTMLISLAEHAHDRAVVILLSGLGTDGSAAVTATKKFGGLSVAELVEGGDPAGKEGIGPSGVVDLRLPASEIAAHIALYAANLATPDEREAEKPGIDELEAQVVQIATILRNVTSHDFHGYKRGTFIRRVQRRVQVLQIDDVAAYIARLREDREEVQNLFQDLLIGVTRFFRDPAEFEILEREIPRLFEGKNAGDQLRVWVLGCATGEEAYSIAILLREHMATLDHPPEVQIFATDLDARALNLARAGRYSDAIADHIRPDRLDRWFLREGDTYCVAKELREMCVFSPHNIVKDPPFSRIDILSCRNLLIYLNGDLQNRVIPIFHFSLRPGGVLFLGSSENVTRHQKLFAPVDRKSRVFRRLETATRIIPDFSLSTRVTKSEPQTLPSVPNPIAGWLTTTTSRQAEAVAERYAPAYVVVDSHFDILHFSGRTRRYLEPNAGAATLNLLNMVHRDLRLDLRSALHRAVSEGGRVELPRLLLRDEDRTYCLNLIVEPIGDQGGEGSLVVLFQDIGSLPSVEAADGDRLATDEHVQRLDTELRTTRDRLQATIAELESTNEELKSSNEEYQSIHEEMQSASEEMETSKEELQSVNEELQTLNGELGHRVSELGRTNSDLKNLLEATQIATVFLDNDLRVRSFTPVATEIFHLLDTDVGRPLDHVVLRVDYPELLEDVRRVLKTLVPVEREVTDRAANRHFSARVLPYRSVDNYISGAVLTFTDMTDVHNADMARRASEERLRSAIEVARVGTWDWNITTDEVNWSDEHFRMEGYAVGEIAPSYEAWAERLHPEDREETEAVLHAAREGRKEYVHDFRSLHPDGSVHWLSARGRFIYDEQGQPLRMIGAMVEITDARELQGRQEVLVAELQHRTRNLLGVVRSVSDKTARASTDLSDFRARFRERLDALSRVQGLLSRLHDQDRVGFDELIQTELSAMDGGDRATLQGPSGIRLRSSMVQTLAMALHELATNAVKYGALGQPSGKLAVRWSLEAAGDDGQPWLHVDWRESGVEMPPPGAPPRGTGQGRELIERALPYQLSAKTTYAFEPDGVHCTISIPVSASTLKEDEHG